MKSVSPRQAIDVLYQHGWQEVRTKGDHHYFRKEGVTVCVASRGRAHSAIPDGTLADLIRRTGIPKNDF